LQAVRERAPGSSILAAVRGFLLAERGVLALRSDGSDEEATEQLRTVTRVITESPALLARERQVFARYEQALAALIATETGARPGAIEPPVAANALVGVHRALIGFVRERALAGAAASQVGREVRARARRAFDLLEEGLGDYGVREG
jgi:hypothetical protein